MPFVLIIVAMLGGLQYYFYGVANRAQSSIAAQVLLSRTGKNSDQQTFIEQLLAVQVQELMKREGISALDLEKGVSAIVNASKSETENPTADRTSPIFTPISGGRTAAKELTEFQKMTVGTNEYLVKAIGSSLPRDPTGYLDLAVCPVVKKERDPNRTGVDPLVVDSRMAKKVRLRLSVKSGFLNALTANKLDDKILHGEIYGNVAEFGERNLNWRTVWGGTRVYGKWLSPFEINRDMSYTANNPYDSTTGKEWAPWRTPPWWTSDPGPKSEFAVLSLSDMLTDDRFKPSAYDETGFNKRRYLPWYGYRSFGHVLEGTSGHYDGPELAWNPQTRSRSLPKFNPEMARILARGTIDAANSGQIIVVPYGQDWSERQVVTAISPDEQTGLSVIDGNLVLNGRDSPVRICGRIFVRGDIVILGKYKSKNALGEPCAATLMAGRNIYVADNVTASDRPTLYDRRIQASVEVAAQISDPKVARKVAEDNWSKDLLTLLAANNVFMGNPFPFNGKTVNVTGAGGEVRTFIEPTIGNESINIGWHGLSNYQNELYYHKESGVLAQPNYITGTWEACYTLPWENVEISCRARTAAGGFVSNSRFVKARMLESAWSDGITDKVQASQVVNYWYLPEGYWKLFLPMNIVDSQTGDMKGWISESEYRKLVRDTADPFAVPDACGRRNVLLNSYIPYRDPVELNKLAHPWHLTFANTSIDAIKAEIDRETGFLTKYGAKPVDYQEIGWDPSTKGAYTVDEMLTRGLELCHNTSEKYKSGGNKDLARFPVVKMKDSIRSSILPIFQDTSKISRYGDWSAEDLRCMEDEHNTNEWGWRLRDVPSIHAGEYNLMPLETMFTNTAEYAIDHRNHQFDPVDNPNYSTYPDRAPYLTLNCTIRFYVAQKTTDCVDGEPTSFAYSNWMETYEGPADLPNNGKRYEYCQPPPNADDYWNSDACVKQLYRVEHKKCVGCDGSETPASPKCQSQDPKKYTYFWAGASSGMPDRNYSAFAGDFTLYVWMNQAGTPSISVNTRFLDGKSEPGAPNRDEVLSNRVKQVDSFLFGNQFVVHAAETEHDRQVQINGGVAGRDFMGRLTSRVGPYRPNFDGNDDGTPDGDATAAFRSVYGGTYETGLAVIWDPRYRYAEDMLQADVGTAELSEGAADAIRACEEGATSL